MDFLLLLGNDILRKFSEKIIKRLFAEHSVKFSSCLVCKLLKKNRIDISGNIIIPCITTNKIIILSNSEDKERNLSFLIIGNYLQRIKTYIRIAISDQYDDTWFIYFLMCELLKIFHTKQKRVTDSGSQKIFDRRKITEIHGMQFSGNSRCWRRKW